MASRLVRHRFAAARRLHFTRWLPSGGAGMTRYGQHASSFHRRLVCGHAHGVRRHSRRLHDGGHHQRYTTQPAGCNRHLRRHRRPVDNPPLAHDARGRISELYDISGYPETFIVGKDRIIRKKLMSATDWNSPDARALMDRLLSEGSESSSRGTLPGRN